MKYIVTFVLFSPLLCIGQHFYFNSAVQIDAEEVISPELEVENISYLLINYRSNLDFGLVNIGNYDGQLIYSEGGELDMSEIKPTEYYEKFVELNYDQDVDSGFLEIVFEDSLFIDISLDEPIRLISEYGKSIACVSFDSIEEDEPVISYIHNVDSTNMRATVGNGSYVAAIPFSNNIVLEDADGSIVPINSSDEDNMVLFSKSYDGKLNWSKKYAGSDFPNVADLKIVDDKVYFLNNQSDGTRLEIVALEDGTQLEEYFWQDAILVNMEVSTENVLLSGWVDTDTPIDLDFSPDETILPAGNARDGVLLSYNGDMKLNWVQTISGPDRAHIIHFDQDGGGNIYATGHVRGESIFGGEEVLNGSDTDHTLFVAHYSSNGSYLGADLIFGEGNNSGRNIRIIEELSLAVSLNLLSTVSENLTLTIENEQVTFENDTDLQRTYIYSTLQYFKPTANDATKIDDRLEITPNPTSNYLNVEISPEIEIVSLSILDMNGRVVLNLEGNVKSTIDVTSLVEGSYMLKLQTSKAVISKCFIKL